MHVHEFAYVRACEHLCHLMRVYICASIHENTNAKITCDFGDDRC